ncbi:MAG: signal recognition particle protein [Chlamydiales bacterium]
MFGALTEKLQQLFTSFAGKKNLTEENIQDAIRQVRLALLDADVNYGVASQFVKRVKEKALGGAVVKSVTPDEQFIKIVHDELVALMGAEEAPLQLTGSPTVIMLCGLQGSGKTTQCAKLAAYLKKKEPKKRLLLAACDLERPAAVLQLKRLAEQVGVSFFALDQEKDPVRVAKLALVEAKTKGFDCLIIDTAGRLHLDTALMEQLEQIKKEVNPDELLFVASAAIGQDAVRVAKEFDEKISITGTILTMLDGSARAGAALSIREVTQKPLKFEGIGEKIDDLQLFNPHSMADRILGMGDVINLVKRAEEHMDEEEGKKLEQKIRKASFTYDDYLKQMGMVQKMGSFKSIFKMLPGFSDGADEEIEESEKEFKRTGAIIFSMTPSEREEREELVPSRRRRIALGSGTSIDQVNRMVKNFKKLKQMCKAMPSMMKDKGKENFLWH